MSNPRTKSVLRSELSNFTMIPNEVFADMEAGKLTLQEYAVYSVLCFRTNRKTGACFPSYPSLMRSTTICRAKVAEALGGLIKKGWVDKQTAPGKPNIYTVTSPYRCPKPVQEMNYPSSGDELLPVQEMNSNNTKSNQTNEPDENSEQSPEVGRPVQEEFQSEEISTPKASVSAVIDAWNATAKINPVLPRKLRVSKGSQLRKSLEARIKDKQWLEIYQKALTKLSELDWTPKPDADRKWVPSLDWFAREESAFKLAEGFYDSWKPKLKPKTPKSPSFNWPDFRETMQGFDGYEQVPEDYKLGWMNIPSDWAHEYKRRKAEQ